MLPVLYRPYTRRLSSFNDFLGDFFEDSWSSPTMTKTSRWSYKENEDEYVLETTLPDGIETSNISAEVRDGVLKIIVPKPEAIAVKIAEASKKDVESAA